MARGFVDEALDLNVGFETVARGLVGEALLVFLLGLRTRRTNIIEKGRRGEEGGGKEEKRKWRVTESAVAVAGEGREWT